MGFRVDGFRVWDLGTVGNLYWVAAKELNLSYYTGEIILSIMFTHYGNSI